MLRPVAAWHLMGGPHLHSTRFVRRIRAPFATRLAPSRPIAASPLLAAVEHLGLRVGCRPRLCYVRSYSTAGNRRRAARGVMVGTVRAIKGHTYRAATFGSESWALARDQPAQPHLNREKKKKEEEKMTTGKETRATPRSAPRSAIFSTFLYELRRGGTTQAVHGCSTNRNAPPDPVTILRHLGRLSSSPRWDSRERSPAAFGIGKGTRTMPLRVDGFRTPLDVGQEKAAGHMAAAKVAGNDQHWPLRVVL